MNLEAWLAAEVDGASIFSHFSHDALANQALSLGLGLQPELIRRVARSAGADLQVDEGGLRAARRRSRCALAGADGSRS